MLESVTTIVILVGAVLSVSDTLLRRRHKQAVKDSLERYQLGTKIVALLIAGVVCWITVAILASLQVMEREVTTSSVVILILSLCNAALITFTLYRFLRDNDDNWFNHQWKKLKSKWKSLKARVKSFRWNPGAKPKFA